MNTLDCFLILGMIAFTIASGLLSATETALFSLSSSTLKSYKTDHVAKTNIIYRLLSRPQDLLVTLLFLNIFVNLLIQNFASNLFENSSSWLFKVGVPLSITLLFGEIIPKMIAIKNNKSIAHAMAPLILKARQLLGPLRKGMVILTQFLSRFLFFFLKKNEELSKQELQYALKISQSSGLLSAFEQELLHGYLDLQDDTIKEHMRPRNEILAFNIQTSLEDLENLFIQEECSKVPVYYADLENIQGIITARDYFIHKHLILEPKDLLKYLQVPLFVPTSMLAKTLLRKLSEKSYPLAIVVDEYGSVNGLISREDLVEVVVGEIQDQRDIHKRYTQSSENSLIASGKLELLEFEELFKCSLPNPHNRLTIGGWLIAEIGDIPPSGSKFIKEGFLFQVLSADAKRIRRLYIRRFNSYSTPDFTGPL